MISYNAAHLPPAALLLVILISIILTVQRARSTWPQARPLVYIAGPMRGYPSANYPAFHAAEVRLRAAGWEVMNPAEMTERIDRWDPNAGLPHMPFDHVMRRDLRSVLAVGALALLPGWEHSEGALLEVRVAQALGLPFYDAMTLELLPHVPAVATVVAA
jgi:hypothetical protein